MNLATAVEFQAEIARLQAEIERLRRGKVGSPKGKVGSPRRQSREPKGQSREAEAVDSGQPVLTDAEREAVEYVAVVGRVASDLDREVLRGLLDRAQTVSE
jgi:hypothetical protein